MNKYSIIIPVYNVEKTLRRCLDSVINQTYKNLEIICVNDGSKDNSLKILNEYAKKDDRIIIVNKENGGLASARNEGIKEVHGDIITFLDSDDWLEIDCIEYVNNIFEENKDIDVYRGDYYLTDGNTKKNSKEYKRYTGKVELNTEIRRKILYDVYNGKIQSFSWLLFLKSDILKGKKIVFNNKVTFMEDVEFFTRLIYEISNIYFGVEPKINYYYNTKGLTKSNINLDKKAININKIRKSMVNTLIKNKEIELAKYANSIYFKATIEMLFLFFVNEKDKNIVINIMQKIFNKCNLENMNPGKLNIYYKLILYFLKKQKYSMCVFLYKMKKILKGIR